MNIGEPQREIEIVPTTVPVPAAPGEGRRR